MAKDKKKGEAEIKLQRVYNIPLRKITEGTPRYRKAKRAIHGIREFLARHMKAEEKDIKLGEYLNMKVWERSIRNIPHHVKVDVTKDSEGKVKAELVGAPVKEKRPESKKKAEKPKEKESKAEEAVEKKADETKTKLDKAKKVEKEEIDLLKRTEKEHHTKKEKSVTDTNTEKIKEKTVERKIFAEAKRQRP